MENRDRTPQQRLSSEQYRQMLVRDGDRRFREWHQEFLRHQQEFLKDQRSRSRELENLRKSIDSDRNS